MHCGVVRATLVLLIIWGMSQLGCAAFGEATARGAVIGSYAGYQELKKEEGVSVDNIVEDPAFREAAHELSKAVVTGAGEGYDEASFDDKADKLVRTMLSAAREESNAAVGQLLDEQGPKIQLIVRQTLATTIRDAGAELRRSATTDGTAAVQAIITAAVEALVGTIDPKKTDAVQGAVQSLTHGLGAGLVAGLRQELERPETQLAVADLSKSAAIGAREGFLPQSKESSAVWTTFAILFGVLFVLSAAALAFYIRKSVMNARTLTVVAQQINKDADQDASVTEMKKRIRERAQRAGVESHLSAFLKDRGM
jgi:hypothetical protein